MNRTTGYMGRKLNEAGLNERVKVVLQATYGDDLDVSNVEAMPLLMIGLADKDNWGDSGLAFINTEGVGSMVEDYNLVQVYYYTSGWGQLNSIGIGRNVLVELATEGSEDIADWVRSFGSRLDSNVSLWQRRMHQPDNQLA
jgi:hypothetical protein